jgi:hypothetical protein
MTRINNIRLAAVWKFGTNWAGNAKSFYEFIRSRNIVIGDTTRVPYQSGDFVLITRGYTVLALTRVTNTPVSVIDRPDIARSLGQFGIPIEQRVTVAPALWLELAENEQFIYQVQRGAARVRHPDTLRRVESLIAEKRFF